MSNKSLGRGLSAFLETGLTPEDAGGLLKVSVDNVRPNPFQPRRVFDEEGLQSLAESIKRNGLLQPILVVRTEDGGHRLVAGERRLRAAKIANLTEIPAVLVEANEREQLEIAILENIQRENLNPLEEAESYERLLREFGRTQEELSGILGKSRSHIANMLRLLTLPDPVKILINEGKLSFGHARALVGTEDAVAMANRIVQESMNVRQVESIRKRRRDGPEKADENRHIDPDVLNLANKMSSLIGLEVAVRLRGSGGVIEISFPDLKALDSFVQKLNN
ncbi:MAG: ParB/RepB/Spo0J family partition protein [Holosporaceae bacterium]|jgi:ParB family chromosome partitioning protein|nr:ParB/RepB/Spo0J family partition protein [Holosporaceae bacterium]